MPAPRSPTFSWPEDPAVADYAAIGNCRTLALVSRGGSIDWLCAPHFSGPSLFGALLDRERGGSFRIRPRNVLATEQRYRPGTNVVDTLFRCEQGMLALTDFMAIVEVVPPTDAAAPQGRPHGEDVERVHALVRIAHCTEGQVEADVLFDPRPGYGSQTLDLTPCSHTAEGCGWNGRWPEGRLRWQASTAMDQTTRGQLSGRLSLLAGEQQSIVVEIGGELLPDTPAHAVELLERTQRRWREWAGRCQYDGPYRDEVVRSALTLKLLSYWPSGAVVAAGTTSIPEGPHGFRNWDYRYCWLRDTSLVLQAFMDLGYLGESKAFLGWLLRAAQDSKPRVRVLYDVLGGSHNPERVIDSLRGYHGIGPVRVGNDAMHQHQLDIYGELLLTAHDYVQRAGALCADEQALLEGFVGVVCDIWREPDEGIWEIRGGERHNTHSKLMCWAALDRALSLARDGALRLDEARVRRERDALRADIDAKAFDPALNAYVGFYGGKAADASLLLMPRLGYLDASTPEMEGTVRQVVEQLGVDGLLYRYPPGPAYDGVRGGENLFGLCSFWLVDCLARQGRHDEGRALFERLLRLRNHVGLYAEEFEVGTLRPLGNFPQAFSHVGLITAALSLWDGGRKRGGREGNKKPGAT